MYSICVAYAKLRIDKKCFIFSIIFLRQFSVRCLIIIII